MICGLIASTFIEFLLLSLAVLDRDSASTHFRGLQRILGCFAGGLFGLCAVRLETESFLVWSAMLIGKVFVFAILHHGGSRWSYLGTQGGTAFILATITGGGPPDSILPAVSRIAGMLCGVGILIFVWSFAVILGIDRRQCKVKVGYKDQLVFAAGYGVGDVATPNPAQERASEETPARSPNQ